MQFVITFIFLILASIKVFAIDTNISEAIVYDYNTQEIIFEKHADKLISPASMTKIMTVYAVFDRIENTDLSLDDICIVSAKAYRMGGSRMFLEINDKVSISDLLRGIIIQSGNDASVAIAECLSGTENDFSKLMNSYSEKLGLKNGESIDHPWINKALERAQQKVEARNFDIRKTFIKFDNVLNDQRHVIFSQRKDVINSEKIFLDKVIM